MSGICPCTLGNSVSKALFNLRDAKKLNCDAPEQTGTASVVSRMVEHNNTMYHESPWLYLVCFRLENGGEVRLQTAEAQYSLLKEGSSWNIAWQEEKLIGLEAL